MAVWGRGVAVACCGSVRGGVNSLGDVFCESRVVRAISRSDSGLTTGY